MSTLRVSTIQDTAGSNSSTPAAIANGIAKAWVNFNGTGTVAIRAQYNVSSITDNGTGDYIVNFTNALADANYAVAATAEWNPGVDFKRASVRRGAMATGSVRIGLDFGAGTSADSELVFATIFR